MPCQEDSCPKTDPISPVSRIKPREILLGRHFFHTACFLVVDTRSVETTIAVGQNMQMCHSLRCKQIDRSTGTQLISIQ